MNTSSQPGRLLYLTLYLILLIAMNRLAFNQWLPLSSEKGLWFYSGAAALIFGSLLVTPFFTSPANAISYLMTALIAVFVFPPSGSGLVDRLPRRCVIFFCAFMLLICVVTILLKDAKRREFRNVAEACRQLANHLGSPRFVYAVVIIYAQWEYHRAAPKELFFIGISGLVIAAQQPLETLGVAIHRLRKLWRPRTAPAIVGSMVAHQTPDLVLFRQEGDTAIQFGMCLRILDKHARLRVVVALGNFGTDEGLLIRALEIEVSSETKNQLNESGNSLPEGSVSILADHEVDSFRNDVYLLRRLDTFVGVVAPDTATSRLYFEIFQERDIEQGRLVEALVSGKLVLYQVLDGLTKEEIVQQKNTYGFARGEASQVGIWDDEKRRFKPCNWIPHLNTPVFLKGIEDKQDNRDAIGHFASTNYHVEIRSLDEMVTHNTAILGILGVGKTMLAIELVERMIAHEIKVICIDLTSQYEQELNRYLIDPRMVERIKKLQELGPPGKTNYQRNVEEGGSRGLFSEETSTLIAEFVSEKYESRLMVLNPSQFEV